MKRYVVLVLALLLVAGCGARQQPAPGGGSEARGATKKLQWNQPPAMQIDPNKTYFATLKTSMGDIRVELFAGDAPITVNNFVFLARQGYYDNVVFHRIIKDFMIQGGDPNGTGSGGPGYTIQDELPPKRSYEPGILAMAKTNRPNSAGSQFFICNGKHCAAALDGNAVYPQFGKVVSGMDVVEKISSVPVGAQPHGEKSKPLQEVWIKTVVIEEK